ncbi:MAG: hypothetical protein GY926_19635 [bacterium]|nr:hypothetical protein [bacterium]
MKKTTDVRSIDLDIVPTNRSGKPLLEGRKLSAYLVDALDQACEQTPSGGAAASSPQDLRMRTKLADQIAPGGTLLLTADQAGLAERCVALHFMPAIASRLLAAIDAEEAVGAVEEAAE